jgi:hypothetical protein
MIVAQSLASLHARVVELASLTNDDRASADDENTFNVGTLGHYFFSINLMKRSKR